MDPNWSLTIAASVFGAVVGLLILLAWSITRWMLGDAPRVVAVGSPRTARARRWILRLGAAAFAVASTSAGFAYLVYPRAEPDKTSSPSSSPSAATASAPEIATVRPPPEPAPAAAQPSVRVTVGRVALIFEPPAGYCLYPPELQEAVLGIQRKANPENAVHVAFGDCEQLRERQASGGRIRDFGLLMTPKPMLDKPVDKSILSQWAQEAPDPLQIQHGAEKAIRSAQRDLEMHSFVSVGVLARSDAAVFFGFLSRLKSGEGKYEQAGLMALTVIRGRLLAYYLYADYRRDPRPQLLRLQQTARGGLEKLAALNR